MHCSANIFSVNLNKLRRHVTSDIFLFNKFKFSRIFPFQQYMYICREILYSNGIIIMPLKYACIFVLKKFGLLKVNSIIQSSYVQYQSNNVSDS